MNRLQEQLKGIADNCRFSVTHTPRISLHLISLLLTGQWVVCLINKLIGLFSQHAASLAFNVLVFIICFIYFPLKRRIQGIMAVWKCMPWTKEIYENYIFLTTNWNVCMFVCTCAHLEESIIWFRIYIHTFECRYYSHRTISSLSLTCYMPFISDIL